MELTPEQRVAKLEKAVKSITKVMKSFATGSEFNAQIPGHWHYLADLRNATEALGKALQSEVTMGWVRTYIENGGEINDSQS